MPTTRGSGFIIATSSGIWALAWRWWSNIQISECGTLQTRRHRLSSASGSKLRRIARIGHEPTKRCPRVRVFEVRRDRYGMTTMVVTVVAARSNRVSAGLPVIVSEGLNDYSLSGDGRRPPCRQSLLAGL